MSRFDSVRAQKIGPLLLFDQLRSRTRNNIRKHKVAECSVRASLIECSCRNVRHQCPWCWAALRAKKFLETIGHHMMLSFSFISDHRFNSSSEADLITCGTGAHEVKEQIRTCH